MKKKILFLLALCAIGYRYPVYAQHENSDASSAVEVINPMDAFQQQFSLEQGTPMFELIQALSSAGNQTVSTQERLYPLGHGLFKKHHLVQALELCPSISKAKVATADVLSGDQNRQETDDTGIGLNFGYSLIFIPGTEEQNQLRLNEAGFAYSTGFIFSFTQSDRYGVTCDLLFKVGLETCYNRKMGLGVDVLGGYGKSSGDVFFYQNILEDAEPKSVIPYTAWGYKYGGQIWFKTGSLSNKHSGNTDVLLFARLIHAVEPNNIQPVSSFHYNFWKEENWSFGAILRYRL